MYTLLPRTLLLALHIKARTNGEVMSVVRGGNLSAVICACDQNTFGKIGVPFFTKKLESNFLKRTSASCKPLVSTLRNHLIMYDEASYCAQLLTTLISHLPTGRLVCIWLEITPKKLKFFFLTKGYTSLFSKTDLATRYTAVAYRDSICRCMLKPAATSEHFPVVLSLVLADCVLRMWTVRFWKNWSSVFWQNNELQLFPKLIWPYAHTVETYCDRIWHCMVKAAESRKYFGGFCGRSLLTVYCAC